MLVDPMLVDSFHQHDPLGNFRIVVLSEYKCRLIDDQRIHSKFSDVGFSERQQLMELLETLTVVLNRTNSKIRSKKLKKIYRVLDFEISAVFWTSEESYERRVVDIDRRFLSLSERKAKDWNSLLFANVQESNRYFDKDTHLKIAQMALYGDRQEQNKMYDKLCTLARDSRIDWLCFEQTRIAPGASFCAPR